MVPDRGHSKEGLGVWTPGSWGEGGGRGAAGEAEAEAKVEGLEVQAVLRGRWQLLLWPAPSLFPS